MLATRVALIALLCLSVIALSDVATALAGPVDSSCLEDAPRDVGVHAAGHGFCCFVNGVHSSCGFNLP